MRAMTSGRTAIAAVLSFPLLTATVDAQEGRRSAPVINLSTALGSSVVSNYIEPSIRLSEDAYVFAISVDVDRNIQVLHPDFPGLSVKMMARKQLHLPSFFAGYGERGRSVGNSYGGYASSSYDGYDPGFTDARGTVIALASRRPFNLAAVTSDGAWDLIALDRLVQGRDPYSAASALARYIGLKGEPIGRDVHRFAGASRYYAGSFYECTSYGRRGYGHPFSQWRIDAFRAAQLRASGYVVRFLGTDVCGEPQYAVYAPGAPTPVGRPPATGAFPRPRNPVAVPRNPVREEAIAGPMAARSPLGQRHKERDATTTSPRGRTRDPRSAERFDPRPATGSFPERRPVPERVSAPARRDFPERSAPAAAPRQVERPSPVHVERPRPAPRPEPVAVKPIDQ